MQFVKILFWVLFLVASFIFWWSNEARSTLDIGAAMVEGRVSTFVITAFLLGSVPLWILSRTTKWRLTRRIKTLEAAARPAPTPVPTPQPSSQPAPAPVPAPTDKPSIEQPTPAVSPISGGKVADA